MNGRTTQHQHDPLEWSRILTWAGEIKRILSTIPSVGFSDDSAAFGESFCLSPETLSEITARLKRHLDFQTTELERVRQTCLRLERDLGRVRDRKKRLDARAIRAHRRLAECRVAFRKFEQEIHRRESQGQPILSGLADRIREERDLLDQLEQLNRLRRLLRALRGRGPAGPRTVAARRSELETLQARLEVLQAALDRSRAGMDRKAAYLTRLAAECERFKAQSEILGQFGQSLQTRLNETKTRQAAMGREQERIDRAVEGMVQIDRLWTNVQQALARMPKIIETLESDWTALMANVSRHAGDGPDQSDLSRDVDRAHSMLNEASRGIRESLPGLLQRFEKFRDDVRTLKNRLQQAAEAFKNPAPSAAPQDQTARFQEQVVFLGQIRDKLLADRRSVEDALRQVLASAKEFEKRFGDQARRRRADIGRTMAELRTAGANRNALVRRTSRMQERLPQLESGLNALIGPNEFIRRTFSVGVDGLRRLEGLAAHSKDELIRTRNRLTADLKVLQALADQVMPREAEEYNGRLRAIDQVGFLWDGLKRELRHYQSAYDQAKLVWQADRARQKGLAELDRLKEERNRLADLFNRTHQQARSLRTERDKLVQDLAQANTRAEELTGHLKDETYPLIQALGQALYQGEVRYSTLLQTKRDLEGQLTLLAASLEKERTGAKDAAGQFSQSLTLLGLEMARRDRLYVAGQKRARAETDQWRTAARKLAASRRDLKAEIFRQGSLTIQQAGEIADLKAGLNELYPLLEFFLQQSTLWARKPREDEPTPSPLPEGSEYLVVLAHILNQENETLKTKVAVLQDKHRADALEKEHLARSQQLIKDRLQTLLPLVDYFWQSWFQVTANLAAVHAERRRLSDDVTASRAKVADLECRSAGLLDDLNKTRKALAAARERLHQFKAGEDESQRREADLQARLSKTQTRAQELAHQVAKISLLLEDREGRLSQVGSELAQTASERDRLESDNQELRLETIRLADGARGLTEKLAARNGLAEAAWAGFLHAVGRYEERLADLQSRVDQQEGQIESLTRQLTEKTGRTQELEQGQDRLAILLWIIAKYGGNNEQVWAALQKFAGEKGFRDAADIVGQRLQFLTAEAVHRITSERFRRSARHAVHRGLYTLLLAGGLILAVPEESSRATALPTLVPAPPATVAPAAVSSVPSNPIPLDGMVYNPKVGLVFDLSALPDVERAKGFDHLQRLIQEAIDAQAVRAGLTVEDYAGLIRRGAKPDRPLRLSDLEQSATHMALLQNHFPLIHASLESRQVSREHVNGLYRLAKTADVAACRFWDRLNADILALEADPVRSLEMTLHNLAVHRGTRRNAQPVAFTGRLKPIPAVEKMSIDEFTRTMAPYFILNIKNFMSQRTTEELPGDEQLKTYAGRLAEDMYVAGRVFGVPLTFIVSIVHQETYFANVLGDHAKSASPFQIYEPTKPYIVRAMIGRGLQVPVNPEHLQDHLTLATYMAAFHMSTLMESHTQAGRNGRAPLCNLEMVARAYNGSAAYPGAVYRKQVSLMRYIESERSAVADGKAEPNA